VVNLFKNPQKHRGVVNLLKNYTRGASTSLKTHKKIEDANLFKNKEEVVKPL
jgi:hypothetical protein